jgi:hypothetical protein
VRLPPAALLRGAVDSAVVRAAQQVLGPVLAEYDRTIADLVEQVRVERIKADWVRRGAARVQRAEESRIKALEVELETSDRHVRFLREELAKVRTTAPEIGTERLAKLIAEALPNVTPTFNVTVPTPEGQPVTAAAPDLAAWRPLIDAIVAALKPEPPGELEILRDDRGNVTGARRKPATPKKPAWPFTDMPEPGL